MKKIYQTPCTDVTVVCTMQMLAVSMTKNSTGADEGVVLTREDKHRGAGSGLWEDMQ